MKAYKKSLVCALCALTAACFVGGFTQIRPQISSADATGTEISLDFTDTMDGANFAAPANNYGWKVTKGALAPDNSIAETSQIGYLKEGIALNEQKYISMDFYVSAAPFDVVFIPYAETIEPWATGIGVHSNPLGYMTLNNNLDYNAPGWIADYTGIGNGVDGFAHKLEIISDGTNLTFKIDGADAFTGATVAIPADTGRLLLRAPEGSYIDNLYIGAEEPTQTSEIVDVDFTDKLDESDFTAMELEGWKNANGKFAPVQEGVLTNYSASAVKYSKALDLTGTKYISFDFYAEDKQFDVGLLDVAAENIWGNSLTIHLPNHDGNLSVTQNIDVGNWLGGVASNLVDGNAHTLEIFVNNGKVSYKVDGETPVLDTKATEFSIPSDSAYLVFRAVGTASYIDNLYIADSAPTEMAYDFASVMDGNAFTAWNGAGWSVNANGEYVANVDWASVQMKNALDLTKNQEITFDVYLSSSEASDDNRQFNIAFVSEENLANASTKGAGVGFSLGSTLWLGTNLGRDGYIKDVGADLYNDTWHSVKISVLDGNMTIAVDGVAYDALTTAIPANSAYMLMQSTSTANLLDNLKITVEESAPVVQYTVTFQNYDGSVLQSGQVEENTMPEYSGATPERAADAQYTYTFKGWDQTISAATGDVTYTAVFESVINKYTVTWKNDDGTILETDEDVEYGAMPEYNGATPEKAMDAQYVYVFKWDKEVTAVTGDVTYTAMFIPVEIMGEENFDFEDETIADNVTAMTHGGWVVKDGKYHPSVAGAMYDAAAFRLNKAIDLTGTKYISFDFYSTAATFDVGLLDTAAGNLWGNALFIHLPFAPDGEGNLTIGVNDYVDCTAGTYYDGMSINVVDGKVHTLEMVIENGKVCYALDGTALVGNGGTSQFDVPSESAYLVFRAVGTDSYIDNLTVQELSSHTLTVKDIQGNEIDTVSTAKYYVLPTLEAEDKGQFIGYYYGEKLYRPSNVICVEQDSELIAVFVDISMQEGASIRLDTPTGLRFTSKIDEAAYNFFAQHANFQIGTLIAKDSDVVVDGDYSALAYGNQYTHLNIQSTSGKINDGYYVYNGVLANVKANHYEWLFAARGYVKATYCDGYEAAFYSNGISRSVSDVALHAYLDRNETKVESGEEAYPYQTEDGDYSPYTDAQRSILQGFIVENNVYVSLTGDDGSSSLTQAESLQQAVELTAGSESAQILLAGGEYLIEETLSIGSNVTIKSLNSGETTLSGAKVVEKSKITEKTDETLGRVWEIPCGEKIGQLYINNSYGVRARYPDAGEELRLFNADETMQTISVFESDVAGYSDADLQGSVMVISIQWAASYLRVKSVANAAYTNGQNTLALKNFTLQNADSTVFSRGLSISPRAAYHFENSKAFLNAQGEWFYDETEQKIYYLPYDGETIENTTVRIPVTETLFSIKGNAEANVANVTFDGVHFAYTANKTVDGKQGGQANRNDAYEYTNVAGMENGRNNAAIEAEFVENITFKNNVFACMGAGALDFLQGASNVTISDNLFRTIGGNGVLVGTLNTDASVVMDAYAANAQTVNNGVYTLNNYFTEIGWQEYGSCAVVYTYAANSKINQNTVNNVNYTGISLGWGWADLQAGAWLENNEIVGNRLTNVMATMNDGGAIYLVGCQTNTLVSGNYIANMYNGAYKYPTDLRDNSETDQYWWANAAIYLDTAAGSNEEATKVVVENNYIASDVENQNYEFCNVANVTDAAYSKYYFTIDGKTGDELTINYANGVTADSVASAGASGFTDILTAAILFGAHLADSETLTLYGANFGESYDGTLTINGKVVSESDITSWSDSEITVKTASYEGKAATVRIGSSNRLYTAMNVDVAAELSRFDGYIDVENVSTWYTALDVQKQTISSVSVSSGSIDFKEGNKTYNSLIDGKLYSVWTAAEGDDAPCVTFTLKNANTVDKFIVYDRTNESEEIAEYRKNIRIVGLTGGEEITLYESGDAQAYENFGMLIVDIEALGYGEQTFTGFRIEKTNGGALSVAEVAVI